MPMSLFEVMHRSVAIRLELVLHSPNPSAGGGLRGSADGFRDVTCSQLLTLAGAALGDLVEVEDLVTDLETS